ncbi:MAG: chromophore lyase CpcT/CpeT [Deltaproteobacteria bacterium]|nr:chromophore lyase CpcT/CpeT [Deltaproteobacteria bacterium]
MTNRTSLCMGRALALALALPSASACGPVAAAMGDAEGDAGGDAAVSDGETGVASDRAVRRLSQLLQGRFDSSAQATRDMRYFDVTLTICRVSAPDVSASTLYIEQALRGRPPYRQRLYVLGSGADGATVATSRVFEFNDPDAVVGLCDRVGVQSVAASDVVEREGCTVTLTLQGDRFVGQTAGRTCLSTLMGAAYATTEITLGEATLDSWDRGYNAMGRQVWGATAGAYRFERRSPLSALE